MSKMMYLVAVLGLGFRAVRRDIAPVATTTTTGPTAATTWARGMRLVVRDGHGHRDVHAARHLHHARPVGLDGRRQQVDERHGRAHDVRRPAEPRGHLRRHPVLRHRRPDGEDDVCTVATYATPEVEIAPLPGVASADRRLDQRPLADRPARRRLSALQGAVNHASSWATAHPGDTVVVVLATDGDPDECDSSSDRHRRHREGRRDRDAEDPDVRDRRRRRICEPQRHRGGGRHRLGVPRRHQRQRQPAVPRGAQRDPRHRARLHVSDPGAVERRDQLPRGQHHLHAGRRRQRRDHPVRRRGAQCPATGNAWYYDNPTAPTEIILCSVDVRRRSRPTRPARSASRSAAQTVIE